MNVLNDAARGNVGRSLHEDGSDRVLDVAVGGSAEKLPETALRQLGRAFLLLLGGLQRRRGATTRREKERKLVTKCVLRQEETTLRAP